MLGEAHCDLGYIYRKAGYLKKAKFHYEEGAMAGQKVARYNLGGSEAQSGNLERGTKQWTIAASAGDYHAMYHLLLGGEKVWSGYG